MWVVHMYQNKKTTLEDSQILSGLHSETLTCFILLLIKGTMQQCSSIIFSLIKREYGAHMEMYKAALSD